MSEGSSDPDLLDLDDLPDTARLGTSDPLLARVVKVVGGIGRWARRQAAARKETRLYALGAVGTIIAAAASVIWQAAILSHEVAALRESVERIEARQWDVTRPDTRTHATTEEP